MHAHETVDAHVVLQDPAEFAVIGILRITVSSILYIGLDEKRGLFIGMKPTRQKRGEGITRHLQSTG